MLQGEELEQRLDELFSNFAGLIVIDDVDALSRRGEDTGEELLVLKAAQASEPCEKSFTRCCYPHALPPSGTLSLEFSGLDFEFEFLSVRRRPVCAQFGPTAPCLLRG